MTGREIDSAKSEDKPYKLGDGGGLYIDVQGNGSKCWRMKYRMAGRGRRLAFGAYD
ncbi:Arm DNA-binding domain-containing protein [Propionivibrio sp.]|uniref:Arm DNA-binding domain-containing protein n=1 Tax=Propionivibrio sp. TaxID=2212460 RepID=UPI00342A5F5C